MNIYQGQLDEYHRKEKEHVTRSSVDGEKIEERVDSSPFPDTSMSAADRNEKTGATAFPQQVPWPNSNEAGQKRLNPGVKGGVLTEDQGWNTPTLISSSRVKAAGVPPVEMGAPDSRTRSDGHTQGATNWTTQGDHNGGHVPGVTNSSRREPHMDEHVPGAVVVPGFDEEVTSRHDEDPSYAEDSQHSEGHMNESNESSTHAITARVVDPEEEHRILREQLHQVLQEEREHAHVAVVHPATIGRVMEQGNKSVVHADVDNFDDDVERGNMTVGQAPIININANVQQSSAMNVDPPKTGGFWHGTRGRLVIAALILVIVAAAVGVTLALVLDKETSEELESITVSTPPPTLEQTPEITSTPVTSEPTTASTMEPTPQPATTVPAPESTPAPTMSDTTSPPTPGNTTENTPMPTPPASSVDNGVCSNAWPTLVDGTVTVGSNEYGDYVSACATSDYGPGAWYQFIGTGRPIKVSTCNKNTAELATVLSVFLSTDGTCNKTVCGMTATGGGSYYSYCPAEVGSTGSTASVDTIVGSLYYASVIGQAGTVGEFGLTIFDDIVGCEDDKELHPVDGKIYAGSNVNGPVTSACDTKNYGPGAWYRFIGTGRTIKVSTCNKNTTELATVLSVFSSTDGTCNKTVCGMTAPGGGSYYSYCPDEIGSTGSTASVDTIVGSFYYASVIGYEGTVGKFGLTIFDDTVGCDDDKEPHPVDGKIYAGSNVNGPVTSACDTSDYGPGAWYRFIGTGRTIKVSTCNKNTTELATVLSVFSSTDDTCNKLVCVMTATGAGSYYSYCPDEIGSTGSTASVDTIAGRVYFVSVIGQVGAVGKFGLSIFDDSPARRRILPEVLVPAVVNEVISDRTDGSFTIS